MCRGTPYTVRKNPSATVDVEYKGCTLINARCTTRRVLPSSSQPLDFVAKTAIAKYRQAGIHLAEQCVFQIDSFVNAERNVAMSADHVCEGGIRFRFAIEVDA